MEFEKYNVQYIFNQAKIAFFTLYSYPAYKIEDGKLVEDRSEKAQALQGKAENCYNLLKSAAKRIDDNKRVPQTWIRGIEDGLPLATAASNLRMTSSEWVEHLERAIRFLKEYKPCDAAEKNQ